MKLHVNLNGKVIAASEACLQVDNRSFRYGDGCFETMRLFQGKILLCDLHMERLFSSLDMLGYDVPIDFTSKYLTSAVEELATRNQLPYARVRLTIYRGNGGLTNFDSNTPGFLIETFPLPAEAPAINAEGLVLDCYPDSVKASDRFSSLKTNNFLCYALAANWAAKQKLDDALIQNAFGRIADTTIANIFIVKDGSIKTPALTECCVAGIARRYLLAELRKHDFPVQETAITLDDVLQANEVFVTNALRGINWVKQVQSSQYSAQLSRELFGKFIMPLFKA